jgi:uncharacterized protein YwgA
MSLTNVSAGSILQLVDRLAGMGKIQVQKLIYFLQAKGVPLEYEFVMHHYGPYSFELENDISLLHAADTIDISVDPDGYGYHIRPGGFRPPAWVSGARDYEGVVAQVVKDFGRYDAAALELAATIHFVYVILGQPDTGELVRNVQQLKPKFTQRRIEDEFDRLVQLSYIVPGSDTSST